MASGRGQSHFNVKDFLQPFMKNLQLVRYPLNVNTSNNYYATPSYFYSDAWVYEEEKEARDKTSFLPSCSYANSAGIGKECKLFDPVITDLGICYSFNAEPILPMLVNSSFKEAFYDAYEYDFLGRLPENAKGAGDTFALTFMIDNSRYLRKKLETWPFKILISSKNAYFDAFSVAKDVKPGYETTFNVQPIEVVGTDGLRDISEKSR